MKKMNKALSLTIVAILLSFGSLGVEGVKAQSGDGMVKIKTSRPNAIIDSSTTVRTIASTQTSNTEAKTPVKVSNTGVKLSVTKGEAVKSQTVAKPSSGLVKEAPKTVSQNGAPLKEKPSVTVNKTTASTEGIATGKKTLPTAVVVTKATAPEKASTTKEHATKVVNQEKKEVQPYVRVRLQNLQNNTVVTSTGDSIIKKGNGEKVQDIKSGVPITIGISGSDITINGKKLGSQVLVTPKNWNGDQVFKVNGRNYRGFLKATISSKGSILINEVPLEYYLYGVVPEEAPPSWPQAALRAQAVAARSYALYNMEQNKNKLYDVESTIWSQVYQGKDSEYTSTNQAVDATRGMIMTYQGRVIDALFHANGGGYTESSVNVWGNEVPYLKAAADFSQKSPSYSWKIKTSRTGVELALKGAHKDIGTLKEIKLSPLVKRPMKVSDRGESGRIKTAIFVGTKGTVTLSGEDLQGIFGLKSTLFDFYVDHDPQEDVDSITSTKGWHTFSKGDQTVYIRGYGWGHGLGLSQWGAAAMASQAKDSDKNYYQKILTHYYKGVSLEKRY